MHGALPGRPRVFRDPIHGDITYPKGEFQELIESILDTRMFQRLRHIRQNGVLSLVFHGAEHSRFSHAMGVAWVAGRMFDAALRNMGSPVNGETTTRDREDTILAALLHDVGHGPFSHTLEEILKSLSVEFDHEVMTTRTLREVDSSDIAKLLGDRRERLVPFIDKEKRDPNRWFYSIVSSALDADRLDYLLRDSTMAGVWTSRFDLDRLISALGLSDDDLVLDVRARDVVEGYLLAMEQMYASIYFHHMNRAASFLLRAIIQRAVDLARVDKEKWVTALFPQRGGTDDPLWRTVLEGQKVSLAVYETLDENHVWSLISLWTGAEDPTLRELASDLKCRRFPKAITLRKDNMPPRGLGVLEARAKAIFSEKRLDRDAKYYIYADKPPRKAYTGGACEEGYAGSIKLLYPSGRCKPIEEIERTVATIIKEKVVYPYLIVPDTIRGEIEAILEVSR